MFSNLELSNTSVALEDLFLEECNTLSPIVDLRNDDDSLKVYGNRLLSPTMCVEWKKSVMVKNEGEITPSIKRKLVGDLDGSVKDSKKKQKLVPVKLEPKD
ncbi:hypothetical protein AAHA92_06445 [Salvia divinorum]|uniref:Uncharacterized protein n=1 Tax=Salvia divinorum TaxID=28513 RepID=A0ABD1I5N4_SALDI